MIGWPRHCAHYHGLFVLYRGDTPHHDDAELNLLVDVLGAELHVTEVFLDVEGKLVVFVRLDDAFVTFQADDDTLKHMGLK